VEFGRATRWQFRFAQAIICQLPTVAVLNHQLAAVMGLFLLFIHGEQLKFSFVLISGAACGIKASATPL